MPSSLPDGGSLGSFASNDQRTRTVLDCVHGLLVDDTRKLTAEGQLRQLVAAFQARGAGVAALLDDTAVARLRLGVETGPLPWSEKPELLLEAQDAATALPVAAAGKSYLLAVAGPQATGRWLFWLEDQPQREWSGAERATWMLAALALARVMAAEVGTDDWTRWLDRARVQQRLEDMAVVIGRLAHDFGNVLTSILGFTELGLLQLTPDSKAFQRITEVYEAAQEGVQLINRLNVFSRRAAPEARLASLAVVVEEEASRLRAAWQGRITLHLQVHADLPLIGMNASALRQLLAALLENAGQAIQGDGTVTLRAGSAEVGVSDCLDLFGDPRPGPCVRLSVTDTGTGFSPEARRRVFAVPFFSTKPGHRGRGLLSVYALLRAHGGGLRLGHGEQGGTSVQVYLPLGKPLEPSSAAASDGGSVRYAQRLQEQPVRV